jgi:hypothetical protein
MGLRLNGLVEQHEEMRPTATSDSLYEQPVSPVQCSTSCHVRSVLIDISLTDKAVKPNKSGDTIMILL